MGNEIAVIQPHGSAAAPTHDFSIRDMERMAVAFAQSGLFGVKTPDQALALCLIAHAEGRHPALAARDYDIIQGRPAKKAEAMLRDFLSGGGKVEWHELSDERADATFSHPLGGTTRIDWDIARAKKAALGGKDMWSKYPRAMLRSRVVSEGVRTVFPNATSGMYVPEEVRDFADDRPATPPAPPAKRARDLTPEPRPDPEPEAPRTQRQSPEEWADAQCKATLACQDDAALDALVAKNERAMGKLAEQDHASWQRVEDAYALRRTELAPVGEGV